MATSDVKVSEGSGKNVATNSISEDAETKQLQRVAINNSAGTEILTSSNPGQVTGANGTFPVTGTFWQTTQPVSLASAPSTAVTNAGTFAVQAAQAGTWTVQPGNTANTTAWKVDGSAVTQPVSLASAPSTAVTNVGTFAVQPGPTTSGGLTLLSTLIASGTNATNVKASAGQLYKVEVFNNSANIGYLKLYNTAGTPTAGSGTPVLRLMVPGNASGAGIASEYSVGAAFGTGIGFTFTGGIADNDTTSVAASAFILNLYYK